MTLLLASLYLVAQSAMLSSVKASEDATSSANILRFKRNLDSAIETISTTINDWAKWDDTYQFVVDNNTEYIKSNLADATLINLKLNMMVFCDQSGNITYDIAYDFANHEPAELNDSTLQQIIRVGLLTNDSYPSNQGLILLNDVPMLVASNSILSTMEEGPSHGTLIMGRFLDEMQLTQLSLSTGLPVSVLPLDDAGMDTNFKVALEKLSTETPIFTQPLNETKTAGYSLLADINGRPVAIAQVIDNRIVYTQGVASLTYVTLALVGIISFIFVITALLLDKIVLVRLSALSEAMSTIQKTGQSSQRLAVQGHDELSNLTKNINSMLETIDRNTLQLENTVKERTRDLYENQKKLESILSASPDAIMALDIEDNIIEVNSQLTQLSGFTRSDLIGKSARSFIASTEAEKISNAMTALQTGQTAVIRFETVLATKKGQFPAELSFSMIRNESSTPLGYVGIIRDLSEKKMLEDRLFASERLAAIGQLAGMVGHDLRNPLAAIKNAAYVLKRRCSNCDKAKVAEMFAVIDKAVDHSDNIINDLLDYSRGIQIWPSECTLKELTQQSLTMIKVPEKVTLVDTAVDFKLRVDRNKVVRVFGNVFRNALDAMPNGGKMELIASEQDGFIVVQVADSGVGISSEALSKIFTPLFTTKAQGMGFGLAISKRIIEAHGGQIHVRSVEGKGTTCTFTLPVDVTAHRDGKTDWVISRDFVFKKD
jgi:PAS domain S-box-containing protein